VFYFVEFGKLKLVYIDTYSRFQWATTLSSEKADSVTVHLLEVMPIMRIQNKLRMAMSPMYISSKMKQFLECYNIKHITGIPYNPTKQAIVERY
jgi:transposase InsO family protein